jgi:hypothetical protein
MAYDFKKEFKVMYNPKTEPSIIDVPTMRFLMVDGKGDPNTSAEYEAAVEALYTISYSIKMSKMSGNTPDGCFDFVVPPLEGLWDVYDENYTGGIPANKSQFVWTLMLRAPEFAAPEALEAAKASSAKKKPDVDTSHVQLEDFTEGLRVQIAHIGSYDDEPQTAAKMDAFATANGYAIDFASGRLHHEIYLGDPRKTAPEKLKTVLRHPIRKVI